MKPVCDFCLSTSVKWRYPADSFIVPMFNFRSVGDWATCGKCSELIENNNTLGLEERSLELSQCSCFGSGISREI